MTAPLRVLHLLGVDDSKKVTVTKLSPDPARVGLRATGNVAVRSLLGDDFEVVTLLCGEIPFEPLRARPFDVVLNAICDADTNAGSLRAAAGIVDQTGVGVFNDPNVVVGLTRDHVATMLQGIDGLVVPRTVRVRPTKLREITALVAAGAVRAPFLFREAGTHGGQKLALVRDAGDHDQLEQFAYDGRAFYASEFVDYRSADGIYRKYRVIVVDGEPIPKHLIASGDWNVHLRDRVSPEQEPELRAEDDAFAQELPAELAPVFLAVHDRLGLDYFGADFGVDAEGRVVLFEANACMRPLVGRAAHSEIPSHRRSTERIRAALRARLLELAGARSSAPTGS